MSGFEAGDWPVEYGLQACSVFADSGMEQYQALYENMAVDLLWNWTNRVFGTYDVTVRPCRSRGTEGMPSSFEGAGPWPINPGFGSGHAIVIPYGVGNWVPVLFNGDWYNIYCGQCGLSQNCTCEPSRINSISLPGPVVEVDQVTINGEVLDPSAYRVDDNRWLIRQDGNPWPWTQNLDLAPGADDTWTVEYTKGIAVPLGGQLAAGTLACELGKAAIADPDCGLPARVQTVTREGVTVGIIDAFADIKDGATGIWSIDSWTQSVLAPRPYASVMSPDTPGTKSWRY